MENKSIKVIDEHNIDRVANVICAIDVDGSDYVVYSIERDSDNDNIFVSKLVKNINETSNIVNIDDSMEKDKMSSLVKELIKYAVDNDSLDQNDRKVSLPSGKVSIVFGRESDGLRDDEVNKCAAICTIPTSPLFPSLNLSQAVQIISYALFTGNMEYKSGMVAVDKNRIGKAVDGMSHHLEAIGYYKWDEEKKWTEQFLSDVIERAALSESELQRFEKIFTKTESIVKFKNQDEE